MSYQTWITRGYGIRADAIETTPERIENLLSLAPNYQKEIHGWFEDCEITHPTVDDYLEFDQDFRLGLATILKKVIKEAEDIDLTACDDYDGATFLVYEPNYPWQMTEKDMTLTEEGLRQIFAKYVNILTDEVLDVDHQSVENGG